MRASTWYYFTLILRNILFKVCTVHRPWNLSPCLLLPHYSHYYYFACKTDIRRHFQNQSTRVSAILHRASVTWSVTDWKLRSVSLGSSLAAKYSAVYCWPPASDTKCCLTRVETAAAWSHTLIASSLYHIAHRWSVKIGEECIVRESNALWESLMFCERV